MRKGRIKRTLLWTAVAVVGLLALLVYTFTPAKLDVTAYPESVFQASTPDPSTFYGDGSIVFVPLPGHTPGSIGMFVNLRSGKRFFFIGDLTWALEGVELPAERPWISRKLVDRDEAQVRASIIKVHRLSKRYPELVIVPAHDRRVYDRIANFPGFEQ
jgi:glyoxylase-like metal-dependent hydrolase (beta-lactamase superfamily II)